MNFLERKYSSMAEPHNPEKFEKVRMLVIKMLQAWTLYPDRNGLNHTPDFQLIAMILEKTRGIDFNHEAMLLARDLLKSMIHDRPAAPQNGVKDIIKYVALGYTPPRIMTGVYNQILDNNIMVNLLNGIWEIYEPETFYGWVYRVSEPIHGQAGILIIFEGVLNHLFHKK